MAKTDNTTVKDSKSALVAHILAAVIYVALGAALLFINPSTIYNLVYSFLVLACGILFIAFGAFYMIKYFFKQEFRRVANYGFTLGVIFIIIGSIFIFKAIQIATFINDIVCLGGLVFGAIMLQQAFALFHIQRSSWFISLIFGAATIAASIYFLVNQLTFFDGNIIGAAYLCAVGAISLVSLLMMALGLRDHKKDSNRLFQRNMEEAPSSKSGDSIFEEDSFEEPQKNDTGTEAKDDNLFDE